MLVRLRRATAHRASHATRGSRTRAPIRAASVAHEPIPALLALQTRVNDAAREYESTPAFERLVMNADQEGRFRMPLRLAKALARVYPHLLPDGGNEAIDEGEAERTMPVRQHPNPHVRAARLAICRLKLNRGDFSWAAAASASSGGGGGVAPPPRSDEWEFYENVGSAEWYDITTSKLYLGRDDTSGSLWSAHSKVWHARPFTPDRELLTRVHSKVAALRQQPLSVDAVYRVAGELIADKVHTTNAFEGNSCSLREVQEYVKLALALDVRPRRGEPALDPDLRRDMDAIMRGAEMYAPLVPMHFAHALTAADPPHSITALSPSSVHIPLYKHLPLSHAFLHRVNARLQGTHGQSTYRTGAVKLGGPMLLAPAVGCHALMTQWMDAVAADETSGADPIEVAARAAWQLLRIHPWADGNGRTARFVTDVLLLRGGLAPAFMTMTDRDDYYNALQWCDAGDGRPFANWLARAVDTAIGVYAEAAQAATATAVTQRCTP